MSATVLGSQDGVRLSYPFLVTSRLRGKARVSALRPSKEEEEESEVSHLSSIRTPPTYLYFANSAWSTNSLLTCGAKRCSLK